MSNVLEMKPQERSWFTAAAGDEDGVAEVAIYDEIGLWGITAADFRDEIRGLGPVTQINVRINSPGGSVFDGVAIYNLLKRHRARVVVTVDGIAASIASVIAMAGDEVIMPETAMMMIHDPSGVVVGTSKEMRELADALDKVKASLVSAYATKSGADREEIEQWMRDETWLSADEAVDAGLADRVEGAVQMAAHFNLTARFKRVPEGLSARSRKESTMTNRSETDAQASSATAAAPAAPAAAVDPAQQPAAAQPAPAPAEPVAAAADTAVASAIEAERQRAADIMAACSLVGRPDDAAEFIAEGKSLSDVVAELRKARGEGASPAPGAGGAGGAEISARHGGATQDPPLRVDLVADMRRRAGAMG